jgi:NAD(P) transhydrogenase
VVIGSGPAGQKAAVQAAKAGKRVLVIEKGREPGGACVHRGTIPSKTLRETTVLLRRFQDRVQSLQPFQLKDQTKLASLMAHLEDVIGGHVEVIEKQLQRNGVELAHGRASLRSAHEVRITAPTGATRDVTADYLVLAVGSQPRKPDNVSIDHENIFDSDSVLSMTYLPASMVVLGGGVVASEYASIFAALGVRVTMIDRGPRPLGFLDPDLTDRFLHRFQENGGTFLGEDRAADVYWNGFDSVIVTTERGTRLESEKLMVALGRVSAIDGLNLEAAGLRVNERGLIPVNEHCQTTVSHIYAVGDVIGPPSLASSGMEQGRRAVCHALQLVEGMPLEMLPVGIYTIPEMAAVGLTEEQARLQHGEVLVGRARFEELARGQISGDTDGFLKLVADATGKRILGVHVIGEGATELVHVGQMGMLAGTPVDVYRDNIFNFPTLVEGFRVAALEIAGRRDARARTLEDDPPGDVDGAAA